MKEFPDVPPASAASKTFERGHLWLYEWVDGAALRFRATDSGLLRFGGRRAAYDPEEIPPGSRHSVRHVRERLDHDSLRAAVDDVGDVVFFGVATQQRRIDYDWPRLPSFLGFEVWHGGRERFLPPDDVESAFRGVGLDPAPTVDREVRARDFDPAREELPPSEWYDGPAAGVFVRNKRGDRARIEGTVPTPSPAEPAPATSLARELATDDRLARVASTVEARAEAVTFETLFERVFETVAREERRRLLDGDVDVEAFRSTLADVVGEFLADRADGR